MSESLPTVFVVAVALVDMPVRDGKWHNGAGQVLLAQRPQGKAMAGLWEFPGGKVENGESSEHALIRELGEELGITTTAEHLYPLTFASHEYPEFRLFMPLYLCDTWHGDVMGAEGQQIAWVRPDSLGNYAMPPADIPLITALKNL